MTHLDEAVDGEAGRDGDEVHPDTYARRLPILSTHGVGVGGTGRSLLAFFRSTTLDPSVPLSHRAFPRARS